MPGVWFRKGVHIFLQALEWLDPCIPVTIYGAGPLEERYGAIKGVFVFGAGDFS